MLHKSAHYKRYNAGFFARDNAGNCTFIFLKTALIIDFLIDPERWRGRVRYKSPPNEAGEISIAFHLLMTAMCEN